MESANFRVNKSFILAAKTIAFSASSLLGPNKSVKCIVDGDGQFEITSNCLKLLRVIQVEHPAISIIHDACKGLHKTSGTCCSTFVFMVGSWLQSLEMLMEEGIPVPLINRLFDEAVDLCLEVASHSSVALNSLTLRVTGDATQSQVNELASGVRTSPERSDLQKMGTALRSNVPGIGKGCRQSTDFAQIHQKDSSMAPRPRFRSMYSRHLTADTNAELAEQKLLAISNSVEVLCSGVARNDLHVNKLLVQLMKILINKNKEVRTIDDLEFSFEDIFIEVCDGKPETDSSVLEGICIASSVDDIRNTPICSEKKPVKVCLMDFDQMLYCQKRGSLPESTDGESDTKRRLQHLQISCVIYSGEDKDFLAVCRSMGLLTLKARSLKHLQALSLSSMNPIVSSIFDLEASDLGFPITLSFVQSIDESLRQRKGKPNRKSVISLQFLESKENFITILVCGTVPAVTNLLKERLASSLRRLENILKKKMFVPGGGYVEKKCCGKLKNFADRNCTAATRNLNGLPRFLVNELSLYRPVVFGEVAKGLERYCLRIAGNCAEVENPEAPVIDDLGSKCEAWKRAMDVVNTISRIDMVITTSTDQ